jgi:hypothetical protein
MRNKELLLTVCLLFLANKARYTLGGGPGLKEFEKLSKAAEDFVFEIWNVYLAPFHGSSKFNKAIPFKTISQIVHPSTEAVMVLVAVNNMPFWDWEADEKNGKHKDDPQAYLKAPEQKWTSNAARAGRMSGWADEGVEKFNELYDLVEKDRATDRRKCLEAKFQVMHHDAYLVSNGKKHKANADNDNVRKVRARNGLPKTQE